MGRLMQRGIGIASLLALSLATHAGTTPHASITLGQPSRACGVLTTETHFGPPNFGENPKTDAKFTAWVLRTDTPVALISAGDPKQAVTQRVQLYFPHGKSGQKFVGKRLCATGVSAEPTTPGDIAPVNIAVDATDTQANPALPGDVVQYVNRRNLCDHFRGEPTPASDASRAEQVQQAVEKYCARADMQLAALKAKYSNNKTVLHALSGYASHINSQQKP